MKPIVKKFFEERTDIVDAYKNDILYPNQYELEIQEFVAAHECEDKRMAGTHINIELNNIRNEDNDVQMHKIAITKGEMKNLQEMMKTHPEILKKEYRQAAEAIVRGSTRPAVRDKELWGIDVAISRKKYYT